MRVDPEAVYLELEAGALVLNRAGKSRVAPAVILHWKDGRRWQRRSFIGSEHNGDTLGAILGHVGEWLDAKGLTVALEQAVSPPLAEAEYADEA